MIDGARLLRSLDDLATHGAIPGGGVSRLALSEADLAGRAQVLAWMRDAGLEIRMDGIGNVVGRREGREPDLSAVMVGSHIDTVATGGRYDGNLGVLAGLEVVRSLDDAGRRTRRPIEVAFFTNEEGARFAPDMMGSLVYTGALDLQDAAAATDAEGVSVGELLSAVSGTAPLPGPVPFAFVELHIEQGPVLDLEDMDLGVVTGVQGISWQRQVLGGQSNHAGTTPMRFRRDAAVGAARVVELVRSLPGRFGKEMVGTVGRLALHPDLVNVVARRAELTVDLRCIDEALLDQAEAALEAGIATILQDEGLELLEREVLVRLAPVPFDPELVQRIEGHVKATGRPYQRLVSGAGHDAQIFAAVCPAAMIFVPSVGGVSHNVREHTRPEHLTAGTQVLYEVVCELAELP